MAHAIFIGKPSRNGQFSMAMLVITRGYIFIDIPILTYSNLISTHFASSQRKIVESAQWSCQLTLYAKFLAKSRCVQDTLATWSFRSFHTVSIQFPYSFHAVSMQFPYSFHTVSIQFPCSFHTVSIAEVCMILLCCIRHSKGWNRARRRLFGPWSWYAGCSRSLESVSVGVPAKKISAEKRSPQKGAMI